jgi:hypothetical protein
MVRAIPGALRSLCRAASTGRGRVAPPDRLADLMQRFIAKTKRCDRTGKVSYRDEHSANRAIVNVATVSQREIVPVRSYQCPFCKHWHLTSREERP